MHLNAAVKMAFHKIQSSGIKPAWDQEPFQGRSPFDVLYKYAEAKRASAWQKADLRAIRRIIADESKKPWW